MTRTTFAWSRSTGTESYSTKRTKCSKTPSTQVRILIQTTLVLMSVFFCLLGILPRFECHFKWVVSGTPFVSDIVLLLTVREFLNDRSYKVKNNRKVTLFRRVKRKEKTIR